jgi:hypothetical protein
MTTRGPTRRAIWLVAALAATCAVGCGGVNRRFVVESNVPGAQVYIDDRPVGAAPAHSPFEYYGYYNVTLVHPDYKTETKRVHVVAPWYAYPPFDFLAEVVWPFRTEDVRRYYFELTPIRRRDTGELISSADALRERGWNLPVPPPSVPDPLLPPKSLPAPAATVLPGPAPATVPGAAPVPPGPSPTPPPSATPPSSPFVPSVTPTSFAPGGGATFAR